MGYRKECPVWVCVCIRNPFNNLTETDPDLTPSGSTKPLNPLISPQYPQIICAHIHTHTPSYITLRNLSGSSRLSVAFLFPFLPHPSNILSVGNTAVIAEVGSFLPAPTQQSKEPHRHVIVEGMCELRLISPYPGQTKAWLWKIKSKTFKLFPALSHSMSSLFCLCLHRVTLYDYQALCWVYSESSDSGHTLLDVSTAYFHTAQPPCGVFTVYVISAWWICFPLFFLQPYFAFFSAVKWILTELVM